MPVQLIVGETLRLHRDGEAVAVTPFQEAALLVLAQSGEGGVSRNRFIELLWDGESRDARHAARQLLYSLNRHIDVPLLHVDHSILYLHPEVEFSWEAGVTAYRAPLESALLQQWLDGVRVEARREVEEGLIGLFHTSYEAGEFESAVKSALALAEMGIADLPIPLVRRAARLIGRSPQVEFRLREFGYSLPPRPSEPRSLAPLVGRQDQLRAYRRMLASFRTGVSLVLIEGPPGSGRTRLLEEFAEETEARRGRIASWRTAGSSALSDVTLQGLFSGLGTGKLNHLLEESDPKASQVVRRAMERQPQEGSWNSANLQLFLAVRELFETRAGPDGLLLAFDDFDRSDLTSIHAVRDLISAPSKFPLIVCLVRTSGSLVVDSRVEDLARHVDGFLRVGVSPLSPADASSLAGHFAPAITLHERQHIAEVTAGLPKPVRDLSELTSSLGRADGLEAMFSRSAVAIAAMSNAAKATMAAMYLLPDREEALHDIGLLPASDDLVARGFLTARRGRLILSNEVIRRAVPHAVTNEEFSNAARAILASPISGSLGPAEHIRLNHYTDNDFDIVKYARQALRSARRSGGILELPRILESILQADVGSLDALKIQLVVAQVIPVPLDFDASFLGDSRVSNRRSLIAEYLRLRHRLQSSGRIPGMLGDIRELIDRCEGGGTETLFLQTLELLATFMDYTQDQDGLRDTLNHVSALSPRSIWARGAQALTETRWFQLRETTRALAAADTAARLTQQLGPRPRQMAANRRLILARHAGILKMPAGKRIASEALSLVGSPGGDTSQSFHLLSNLASSWTDHRLFAIATDLLLGAESRLGRDLSRMETITRALQMAELLVDSGGFPSAREWMTVAESLMEAKGRRDHWITLQSLRGLLALEAAQLTAAREAAEAIRSLSPGLLASSGYARATEVTLRCRSLRGDESVIADIRAALDEYRGFMVLDFLRLATFAPRILQKYGENIEAQKVSAEARSMAAELRLHEFANVL